MTVTISLVEVVRQIDEAGLWAKVAAALAGASRTFMASALGAVKKQDRTLVDVLKGISTRSGPKGAVPEALKALSGTTRAVKPRAGMMPGLHAGKASLIAKPRAKPIDQIMKGPQTTGQVLGKLGASGSPSSTRRILTKGLGFRAQVRPISPIKPPKPIKPTTGMKTPGVQDLKLKVGGMPVEDLAVAGDVLRVAMIAGLKKWAGHGEGVTVKEAARLTSETRESLSDSDFVFPGERRYPIQDASHARSALQRVSQHGSDSEKSRVRSAVSQRYPGIGGESKAASLWDFVDVHVKESIPVVARVPQGVEVSFDDLVRAYPAIG